ncbi:23849_t:CDS:2 [Gigaspora rosea]|nr:23849_t:CDS:2 [Gigaspora rosea]
MSQRNQGPCKVTDCNSDNVICYHKFTTKAMEKSIAKIHLIKPDRNNKGKLAELITNKKIHEIFTLSEVINDEWKDITINISNNEVILNEDDFTKLINRTNQLEIFQAEINQKLNNKIDSNNLTPKRLESSDNILKEKDNNDDDDENDDDENNETNETQILSAQDSINLKYLTAINDVHNW